MSKKRKRLKKLIMGLGNQRDVAELIIEVGLIMGLDYQEQVSVARQVLAERKARSDA